jgi:type IV pilus assembly protein PilA
MIQKNNTKNVINSKKGFTLIEILVVIGIIAVLSAVVLVAINPARQFKLARDSQRVANITAILNAVGQNMAEHKGIFDCPVLLLAASKVITSVDGGVNIASCLVPTYISSLPFDPSKAGARFTSVTDYDTQYSILQDTEGRVTVTAIGEITPNLTITR